MSLEGAGSQGDLRQSLLKNRIAKLPNLPAISPSQGASGSNDIEHQQEDDIEGDTLGNLAMAPPPRSAFQRSVESRQLDRHYTPISAADCFSEALEIDLDDGEGNNVIRQVIEGQTDSTNTSKARSTFRVYYTPPSKKAARRSPKRIPQKVPAAKVTLSSLSAIDLVQGEEEEEEGSKGSKDTPGTIFFLHHGAGYSGLSYALVAKHITRITKGEAGVLSLDCRGHGKTRHETIAESEALSTQNLTSDCIAILSKLFPLSSPQPILILVGHSMGGSIVVSLSHALNELGKTQIVPRVAGVAVLDVVEGSALAALPNMKQIISALPKGFGSIEEAIRWHVDSGTIVNAQSARRSVPSLLVTSLKSTNPRNYPFDNKQHNAICDHEAVEELLDVSITSRDSNDKHAYTWRANLLATEQYWDSWFRGLSQSFLTVKCARLLLLAGTDRLDKDLMIGQMQGKYQLVIFADVGHSLQEDAPERTAQTLVDFWKRNEDLDVNVIRTDLRKVGEP